MQRVLGDPPEWYDEFSPFQAQQSSLRAAFAQGMRETKICVVRQLLFIRASQHELILSCCIQFDSALERKLIRKYAQAFLSGCVVASDLPTDQEGELRKFVIEVSSSLVPWLCFPLTLCRS